MTNYQITTNGRDYPLTSEQLAALDLVPTGHQQWNLLHEGKNFAITLRDINLAAKTVALTINGREHDLALSDEVDLLVQKLGFSTVENTKSKDAVAPMPGLVLDLMVAEGDTVEAGSPLLILEAMKMENVLKSEGDGTIKSIKITKGEAVEKRQLLIEIE